MKNLQELTKSRDTSTSPEKKTNIFNLKKANYLLSEFQSIKVQKTLCTSTISLQTLTPKNQLVGHEQPANSEVHINNSM